nr:hypothetical protein [Desulfobulbaceae bacterium]
MSNNIKLNFEWLSSEATTLDRIAFAAIDIRVNGCSVTELEDINARTIRSTARVSAYQLAFWFAANWWRLIHEPERETLSWRMSHCLGAAGGGFVWPDLTFASDGEFLLLSSRSTRGLFGAPVRYINSSDETISLSDFGAEIDRFIEAVLERVASCSTQITPLAELWQSVREERQTFESSKWRTFEALLGCDPDEADEQLIIEIQGYSSKWGNKAVEEIVAGTQQKAAKTIGEIDGYLSTSQTMKIPNLTSLRSEINTLDQGQSPWRRAAYMASQARAAWGVGATQVMNGKLLADIFSLSEDFVNGTRQDVGVPIGVGCRNDYSSDYLEVVLTKRPQTGRHFELARLMADNLIAPSSDVLLPVTLAKTARQKFQRSFAQELLCPFAGLAEFLGNQTPDDETIEEAASYYHVSPLLVKTTLVNRGRLGRDVLIA